MLEDLQFSRLYAETEPETAATTATANVQEKTVERVAEARLPTEIGEFRLLGYRSLNSDEEFIVLTRGRLQSGRPTLVRIHSQCLTGDVFGSTKCDCGQQLQAALELGARLPVEQFRDGRGGFRFPENDTLSRAGALHEICRRQSEAVHFRRGKCDARSVCGTVRFKLLARRFNGKRKEFGGHSGLRLEVERFGKPAPRFLHVVGFRRHGVNEARTRKTFDEITGEFL